jgi:hypothetical protein
LDQARMLSLPPLLTNEDINDVIRAFRKVAKDILG